MKVLQYVLSLLLGFLLCNEAYAQKTIDQLSSGGSITGTELLPMFQGANPAVTTTPNALKTFIGTGGGAWTITGFTVLTSPPYAVNNFTVSTGYLGGGLMTNQPSFAPSDPPWTTQLASRPNVITQTTGSQNVLRNASFCCWEHYKFATQDGSGGANLTLSIASFSATISGQTMTVSGTPTGTLALWQEVSDAGAHTLVTTAPTAVGGTVLTFASTTGIVAGMWVTDLDVPYAIGGDITVSSTTGTTVTLSSPVGRYDNLHQATPTTPGVASGHHIAFRAVPRGTEIVGCPAGGCGGAGAYKLGGSMVPFIGISVPSSTTMTAAGGWAAEGVYVIPVGTPGNSALCSQQALTGAFAVAGPQCQAVGTGGLTDLIFRFVLDSADETKMNCMLYAGPPNVCVNAWTFVSPVTFTISATYVLDSTLQPSIGSRTACSMYGINNSRCPFLNDWKNATVDLGDANGNPIAMPSCHSTGVPPENCVWSYVWVPLGVLGGFEVEFHTNALAAGNAVYLQGMDLKQTPSATCAGTSPPCFNYWPPPLEVPSFTADIDHNARFAQFIGGGGWVTGINAGNTGWIETATASVFSATSFYWSWQFPVAMRCDFWAMGAKGGDSGCPAPVVYFGDATANSYLLTINGGQVTPSAMAVAKYGFQSIQFVGTGAGMTAGQAGFVQIGPSGNGSFRAILVDSAIIGGGG